VASDSHAEKFLAELWVIPEAAEHTTCDQIGVGLMHAARSHAMMRCPDEDANATRLERIADCIGNLRCQFFLNLKTPGIGFDEAGKLADADNAAIGNAAASTSARSGLTV
jgi:hypothetical protein